MFGKFNLGELMKNASKMQNMMEDAQKELAKIEVHGESGAGAVKVIMNAKHYVKQVSIDPVLFTESAEDKTEIMKVLEELIAAAMNNANNKVEEITKSKMMNISSLLGGESDEK